ncbi:hypothetical protein SARC_06887 [Sphaeroforma arctica JP610]|uniref:tRNA-specific 2-thiouridylase MnmA-like C-terminal domain-containing protein n=1 Tax=Sphaeroforma arctica JP610 TaxID=667725 RepID=A0A0L0FV84_9EUKA|nr:hypothetical protein SARC_06887 [Sphaeroforma arctica JP610]KNC80760.1 hypothetical protein SARC_06887 [Sphaeroforma arctica JP610]|eukprot:XP_014154662.1 hypothetical protein SARC_06887 [Sphaeroforma arctica JP610]
MGSGKEMPHTTRCQVRARYQQRLAWATVTRTKSSIHASGSNEPCIQPHPLQADRDNVIPADIHPYIPEKGSQSATSGSASDMGVSVQCVFDNPHYCVTPGQMLVAYDGVVCLGGGVIDGFGPTMYTTQRNIKDGMVGVGRVTQDDMTPGSESD